MLAWAVVCVLRLGDVREPQSENVREHERAVKGPGSLPRSEDLVEIPCDYCPVLPLERSSDPREEGLQNGLALRRVLMSRRREMDVENGPFAQRVVLDVAPRRAPGPPPEARAGPR